MSKLRLVEITAENLREVCKLSETLTPQQNKCVAPNSFSIAQAHFYPDNAWYRGIYLDDMPIGFIMLDINLEEEEEIPNTEKPCILLWRFMIAKDYQGKDYGKQSLDIIVEKFKDEGCKYLYTSCVLEEDGPYKFYTSYGFLDTGRIIENERLLKIYIE